MITRYRDHAANERTHLAWVRTGITVMMLGFLVEKFELFITTLVHQAAFRSTLVRHSHAAHMTSVALIVFGLAMIALATLHYIHTMRAINSNEDKPFRGHRISLLLTAFILVFGIYLLLQLGQIA